MTCAFVNPYKTADILMEVRRYGKKRDNRREQSLENADGEEDLKVEGAWGQRFRSFFWEEAAGKDMTVG